MSEDPYYTLRRLIEAEHERTKQYSSRVRIRLDLGAALCLLRKEDWEKVSSDRGLLEDSAALEARFKKDGAAAANGLKLWAMGPYLEVGTPNDPKVTILVGTPI